jgi:hypothetical protein
MTDFLDGAADDFVDRLDAVIAGEILTRAQSQEDQISLALIAAHVGVGAAVIMHLKADAHNKSQTALDLTPENIVRSLQFVADNVMPNIIDFVTDTLETKAATIQ